MTTIEKQWKFSRLLARLLAWLHEHGYEVAGGEWYRTPAQAALNAKLGVGISNSLHTDKLAIDLHLWKDGRYLSSIADVRPVGEFWKSLDPECRWGGDFSQYRDIWHFSLAHGGRA